MASRIPANTRIQKDWLFARDSPAIQPPERFPASCQARDSQAEGSFERTPTGAKASPRSDQGA
ncbi:MAG: hypothetical protein DMF95_13785 [Acidobacteria bacterium]|nr:MAG: hypothetical protein DMF96_25935 [Acidobacteriota bacterium]PYR22777.1 MAG: hypothetical protein DMF94_03455 [Acidobacteriota bacterium]PYR48741.1 MAG: hypothetical protein DMF95_13785 [Acidobacteriota bacterium]